MVAELIKEKYNIKEKEHFISTRKGILNLQNCLWKSATP